MSGVRRRAQGPPFVSRAAAHAFAVCIALAPPTAATAQWPTSVLVEQDVFLEKAEDKDYTMGVAFDYANSGLGGGILDVFDQFFLLHGVHERHDEGGTPYRAFLWGHTAFAPLKGENGATLARTDPIYDDRPYASMLFASMRRSSVRGANALTTEVTLGVLGLPIGEWTQTWIHENVSNDVTPGGWQWQISDGGEPTAAYRATYLRRVVDVARDATSDWLDLAGALEGSVGYYTMAATGARLRLGILRSPWWAWHRSPIPSRLPGVIQLEWIPEELRLDGPAGPKWWVPMEAYVFGTLGGTLWGYNALMQGQFKESEVTQDFYGSPAPMNRGEYSYQYGLTLRWPSGWGVTWIRETYHSPLLRRDPERGHEWGTWVVLIPG